MGKHWPPRSAGTGVGNRSSRAEVARGLLGRLIQKDDELRVFTLLATDKKKVGTAVMEFSPMGWAAIGGQGARRRSPDLGGRHETATPWAASVGSPLSRGLSDPQFDLPRTAASAPGSKMQESGRVLAPGGRAGLSGDIPGDGAMAAGCAVLVLCDAGRSAFVGRREPPGNEPVIAGWRESG
jgi:hypothetical protein